MITPLWVAGIHTHTLKKWNSNMNKFNKRTIKKTSFKDILSKFNVLLGIKSLTEIYDSQVGLFESNGNEIWNKVIIINHVTLFS